MIEFDRVSVSFDGRPALRALSFSLVERRIAVIGSNGSGKSTLARLLNALILPDEGEVCVAGHSTRQEPRQARRLVGLVFQNPDTQIVMPTVSEDLAFGLKNLKWPKHEIENAVDAALRLHGLTHLADSPAHLLSGGEKKLLSVLSVLVMRPDVVVFDEPFAFLDLPNKRRIESMINGLSQRIITITHDLETLPNYERVLVLKAGALLFDGAPQSAKAAYLASLDT